VPVQGQREALVQARYAALILPRYAELLGIPTAITSTLSSTRLGAPGIIVGPADPAEVVAQLKTDEGEI
jgi:hypothetical protein